MPRRHADSSWLAEVVPPRAPEESMSAARGFVASVAAGCLSLEVAMTAGGPRWYVRAPGEAELAGALSQLRIAYPQCAVGAIDPADDPLHVAPTEHALMVALSARNEPVLPLRTDWRHERDPLAGVLTTAALASEERVVARLSLMPAPERVAADLRRRTELHHAQADRYDRSGPSPVPLLILMGVGAGVLQGYEWYRAGEWASLALSGAGALVVLPAAAALWSRFLRPSEPLPAPVVDRKLTGPLFAARLEVCAVSADQKRAGALAREVAAAFVAYDDPAGGGVRGERLRRFEAHPGRPTLHLNTAEVAALWHLPEMSTTLPVRRTTAQRLAPAPGHAASGVRVGVADVRDPGEPVHLPVPLLHRNQIILAKTRRGKSTLLRHLASGVMERVAAGADDTALVVVDPHQDLAEAVLASIPDALVDRTVYLDFANLERPVGLNLIDIELFPDRDRTTEHIVTMLNRLWPQNWGPRMEGALRAALATLHELNALRPRDQQYTLLDVAPLLTDAKLRASCLLDIADPALQAWWRDNYDRAGRVLQQQTANPVTSKIGRFTVTEASRLVLGQSQSTFDLRALIRDGGVLVVNTAVGALGEGAASLVGATLLNLLGLLIEEQVSIPAAERRRVVQLVDESSTLGAVDYPRMLSELGKYGASFVLVSQSLAKLDAIDRNLAPTIFANSDGLTAFQVSAEDARRLTPELGGGIEVEDLVSLDDYTCYARWWDGRSRPAAFSFRVDPPPFEVRDRAQAIARQSALRHGRPRAEVVEEVMRALSERSVAPPSREAVPSSVSPSSPGVSTAVAPSGRENVPVDRPARRARGKGQRPQQPEQEIGDE